MDDFGEDACRGHWHARRDYRRSHRHRSKRTRHRKDGQPGSFRRDSPPGTHPPSGDKRKKKQTKQEADSEAARATWLACACPMLMFNPLVGLLHLFNLVSYYEDESSKAYCEETGLATWVLSIAWVAGGGFPHQFLSMVSWCLIDACLDNSWVPFILSQILIVLLQIYWFCSGQSARPPTHPHTHHTHPHIIQSWSAGRLLILRSHSRMPQACSWQRTAATTSRMPI